MTLKDALDFLEANENARKEAIERLESIRYERIINERKGLIYHPPLTERTINLSAFRAEEEPSLRYIPNQESLPQRIMNSILNFERKIVSYIKR